jgi:hypothetical protein
MPPCRIERSSPIKAPAGGPVRQFPDLVANGNIVTRYLRVARTRPWLQDLHNCPNAVCVGALPAHKFPTVVRILGRTNGTSRGRGGTTPWGRDGTDLGCGLRRGRRHRVVDRARRGASAPGPGPSFRPHLVRGRVHRGHSSAPVPVRVILAARSSLSATARPGRRPLSSPPLAHIMYRHQALACGDVRRILRSEDSDLTLRYRDGVQTRRSPACRPPGRRTRVTTHGYPVPGGPEHTVTTAAERAADTP